jgi:predicted nucleic acid-binding protein
MGAWEDFLDLNAYVCVELHEPDWADVDRFMALGFGSYDAVHAATAKYADVEHIATLDASFALDKSMTLHIDPSRLKRCRNTRGGKAK